MSATPVSSQGSSSRPSMMSGQSLLHKATRLWKQPTLLVSVAVTALLLCARHQGLLERLELGAFDQSLQMRPALEPDPRLLVVTITESDIQAQKQWPISDVVLQKLLLKLEQLKPRVIGLDMYRDVPVPANDPFGHRLFIEQMQKSNRIVAACKFREGDNPGVPPPPGVPKSRVGFIDLLVDPTDGVIRRGLLSVTQLPAHSVCQTKFSFAFHLAQHYLEKQGIEPALAPPNNIRLGKAVFKPLSARSSGYQHLDAAGFQILLNYRSPNHSTPEVTLTQVLNDQLPPGLVKDRLVLIGVTAPSANDTFNTPYSTGSQRHQKMPGVLVHAQLTSQILGAALDGQSLFWFWSEWTEALWIWGWSLIGGVLAWRSPRTVHLLLAEGVGLGVLLGTYWVLFTHAGWVPVVPPVLALAFTSSSIIAYKAYRNRKDQEKIVQQAQEQQEIIAQLNALLKDTRPTTVLPLKLPDEEEEETEEATALAEHDQTQEVTTLAYTQEAGDPGKGTPLPTPQATVWRSSLLQSRYKILKVLGAGGFGLTFLAEDIQRPGSPQCVVKLLKPARRDDKFLNLARRLFKTEAEILERLGHHSQIPQLLAYFEENQEFYLVQELIEGHSLGDELTDDQHLPEAQVVELVRSVLEILAFIHNHGVIHRDIKPSNIIRRQQDGRLVLIDFGAVKEIQPQEASEQELTIAIGTRGYTPPEQSHGRPRFTSDIYALGMIAIQALTGIHPNEMQQDAINGDICWHHLAVVGGEFRQIIDKMVCYHFVERYQSAEEVLQDLKRLGI